MNGIRKREKPFMPEESSIEWQSLEEPSRSFTGEQIQGEEQTQNADEEAEAVQEVVAAMREAMPSESEEEWIEPQWYDPSESIRELEGSRQRRRRRAFNPMLITVAVIVVLAAALIVVKQTEKTEKASDGMLSANVSPAVFEEQGQTRETVEESMEAETSEAELSAESTTAEREGQEELTETSEEVQSSEALAEGYISGTLDMSFQEVADAVTALTPTNLRTVPTTEGGGTIIAQLKPGQVALRTGINEETGWSRVEFNGSVLYAVTLYLSADVDMSELSEAGEEQIPDGWEGVFADCDDNVVTKDILNLRTEPSTARGRDSVRARVARGVTLHRTGISVETGWSRVEYNGETLYVLTANVEPASNNAAASDIGASSNNVAASDNGATADNAAASDNGATADNAAASDNGATADNAAVSDNGATADNAAVSNDEATADNAAVSDNGATANNDAVNE